MKIIAVSSTYRLCSVNLRNNNGRWEYYSGGYYCFRRPLKSARVSVGLSMEEENIPTRKLTLTFFIMPENHESRY